MKRNVTVLVCLAFIILLSGCTKISGEATLNQECISISDNYTWDKSIQGNLVLASSNLQGNEFLDMSTGARISITNNKNDFAYSFQVSPDGEWLAYIHDGEPPLTTSLIVQSANKKEIFEFPVDFQEWQTISYWLNNETLILRNHAVPLDNIVVFNPFTGEKQVMNATEYPKTLPDDWEWDYWPSLLILDPLQRYLTYVGISGDTYHPGDHKLVLWNLENRQVVTEVNDFGYSPAPPLWKQDGSGLILVKSIPGYAPPVEKDDLLFLSVDGKVEHLAELGNYFQYAKVDSYSLSPNEAFLALSLVTTFVRGQTSQRTLLILDLSTLNIMDTCLLPQATNAFLTWSPDSKYLAFAQLSSKNDEQTVVLDVFKNEAFIVAEKFHPEGWLIDK